MKKLILKFSVLSLVSLLLPSCAGDLTSEFVEKGGLEARVMSALHSAKVGDKSKNSEKTHGDEKKKASDETSGRDESKAEELAHGGSKLKNESKTAHVKKSETHSEAEHEAHETHAKTEAKGSHHESMEHKEKHREKKDSEQRHVASEGHPAEKIHHSHSEGAHSKSQRSTEKLSGDYGYFKVEDSGLSLSLISVMLYGSMKHWKQIAEWNHIEAPYEIKLRQKLLIRGQLKVSRALMNHRLLTFWRARLAKRGGDPTRLLAKSISVHSKLKMHHAKKGGHTHFHAHLSKAHSHSVKHSAHHSESSITPVAYKHPVVHHANESEHQDKGHASHHGHRGVASESFQFHPSSPGKRPIEK